MKNDRIGLFGGTFNPIHRGHIRVAENVEEKFNLGRILFIPSYIPPHKGSFHIASPEHRMEMVKLAVSIHPGFHPSAIEIEEKGTSYSIFTLKKVRKIYSEAEIFFILGIDAFLEIETWKDTQEVLRQCSFIVVSRPGYRLGKAHDTLGGKHSLVEIGEGTDMKIVQENDPSARIFLFTIDALDISSSEIRQRAREGLSIKELVPESVEIYIQDNMLYQERK